YKVFLFALLSLFLFIVSPIQSFADKLETEPNDSFSTATLMNLNEWYNGDFHANRDYDYYKIILPSDGNIEVLFNNDSSMNNRPNIYVVNGSNNEYVSFEGRSDLVGDEKAFVSLPQGEYYIKVYSDYSSNSTYK